MKTGLELGRERVVLVRAPSRHSFVDLTDDLQAAIDEAGLSEGLIVAFCSHTTCALLINEWEQGVLADLIARIQELVPDHAYYRHDDFRIRTENLLEGERRNGPAHVAAMLLNGTSQAIPVVQGRPAFGRWQRLYLLELDEPKQREIRFHSY